MDVLGEATQSRHRGADGLMQDVLGGKVPLQPMIDDLIGAVQFLGPLAFRLEPALRVLRSNKVGHFFSQRYYVACSPSHRVR